MVFILGEFIFVLFLEILRIHVSLSYHMINFMCMCISFALSYLKRLIAITIYVLLWVYYFFFPEKPLIEMITISRLIDKYLFIKEK